MKLGESKYPMEKERVIRELLEIWKLKALESKESQKIAFVYLANDIVQKSKINEHRRA